MNKRLQNDDERGIAHIAIIALVVVVVGAVGFAGWRVTQKDKDGSASNSTSKEIAKEVAAECKKEIDDKDLCKFFTSWGNTKKFAITSTDTSEGTTTKSIMKIDGENTYMKLEGEMAYEVITMGNTTYTKSGDVWWKQTAKTPDTDTPAVNSEDFKFEEPSKDTPEAQQTKYEKQGKEACGSLTCFKYKVVDPTNTDTTEYIWFDDKDYLSRKTRTEDKDGSVSEQIYEYNDISVSEPSPVKELGPNQYIMPGQTEPMTIPDASSLQ